MVQHKQLLKQLYEQDNKTHQLHWQLPYLAIFSQILLHFKNTLKSTVLIDRLKADKLVKTTDSGKLFYTFTTLQAKKSALTLLHR